MSKEEKEENIENNPEEGEEPVAQPQKEEKLVIMKKGDYNVHILIEEVKNLIEIEENSLPVPRVKMTVFGKTQRTSKMKKPCDSFVFNEHFYFDKTNLTAEMLDSEKIVIEVYDNKHTKKPDYFGIYEFDFGYVYNQEDHALHNVWIGLANPESDNISKIRGYLKISISVLQESDQRVELESVENELSNCIIPAQIQMKYKQISFYFFLGEEFPDMDATFSTKKIGRRCDGYIEVKYMGIVRKTKVSEMKDEKVVWNQIVDIPATKPAVSQKICMVVKDQDIGSDDIVGSIEVKIDDIYAGKYNELQNLNIYGSPINKKGKIYDQMNYNAEIGSRWNGRILMKCEVNDADSPIARVTDIPKNVVKEAMSCSRKNIWKVKVRILSAIYLPEDNGEYAIRVSIQEKSEPTRFVKAINGCCEYNQNINLLLNTFSNDKFELPDLFIYLVDKKNKPEKQNICFQRVKADEFHLNKDIIVLKLLPDPCVGKCKNMMKSGILKCKIFVYNQADDKDIPSDKEFNQGGMMPGLKTLNNNPSQVIEEDDLENLLNEKEEEPEPVFNPQNDNFYTIAAIVYMSKGLVAAESNGTSDPFVRLTFGDKKLQTSVKNNTMNGIWNELLLFSDVIMDINDKATWPIFLLSVFDYNKIKSNVPLGYNYVWLSNAAYLINEDLDNLQKKKPNEEEKDCDLQPKWHNLFLPKSNKQQGQILLSFYIFQNKKYKPTDLSKQSLLRKLKFTPKVSLYNCEVNILGLRQLKPLGMIAVKKPFIKFDLNSLNVTGKPEDAHANIQTVPVSGGSNPTINTVIKFDAKLPINQIFMPELQCEVYDHMLSGLHNSLLGVFSLDLKRLIKKTHRQIDEDLRVKNIEYGTHALRNSLRNSLNDIFKNMALNSLGINQVKKEEDENIISTSSNIINSNDPLSLIAEKEKQKQKQLEEKDKQLLKLSNAIQKGANQGENNIDNEDEDSDKNSEDNFIEVDENKTDDKGENLNIDKIDMGQTEITLALPGKTLSNKNTIKLDGNFLKNNINSPEYFVAFPTLKKFKIPGYTGDDSYYTDRFLNKDKKDKENKDKENKDKENKDNENKDNENKNKENEKNENNEEKLDVDNTDNNNININENVNNNANNNENSNNNINNNIENLDNNNNVIIEEEKDVKVQKEFYVEDLSKAPNKKLYFEIGYLLKVDQNILPEESTKHYRRIYGCPLENVDVSEFKIKSPFNVRKIRRGKFIDKVQETSLFDAMKDVKAKVIYRYGDEDILNESQRSSIGSQLSQVGFLGTSQNQDEKSYGKFKGLIRIAEKGKMEEYEAAIKRNEESGAIDKMVNLNKYENLRKRLINRANIIIRVYVLELNNLAKKDLLSESDPYIKILLNDKEIINERKNYQDNQKNCKWYKYYDIAGEIPGSSSLKIEVWDWDEILSDDLIGSTVIDLEDRYYNDDWQNMKHKPVEVRPLLHPDLNGSQGQVYMWLEMFEASEKANHLPWKIDPEPICELQVRFIVWETEDMEIMDVEGTSDIYVIGYIDQKESQKTDTHFRCQTGIASFNWRMLLPLRLPTQKPVLTLQVYDKDIFSSDDYMCGATIDMKNILDIPKCLEIPMQLNRDYYHGLTLEEKKSLGDIEFLSPQDDEDGIKFWVRCYKGKKEAAGQGEKSGRVMVSLEILPKKFADLDKVGKGRDNPNVNPYLPPPFGRIEFTLNPFKMMNQCVGPKFRRKCYCYCLCSLLTMYLVYSLPNILSYLLV